MIPAGLRDQAVGWLADDPGPADRAELQDLLTLADREDAPGRAALGELADRFAGRLEFGTAGLRGAIGAGPNRMNRAVVRGATAALARWLRERHPAAAGAGVVIGWDARHRSAEFAEEAAAVLTGAGIRVHLLPGHSPTPLLAFAVRHLSAGAGVMITASHNPPADNGYKLYLGDGAQIVPPADAQIEAAIRALGPLSRIPLGPASGPLVTRYGDEVAQAYLDAILAASPGGGPPGHPAGSGTAGMRVVYTPLHGVAGGLAVRAIERAGYPAPHVVAAQAEPDPDFPTVSFPNPEEPGALDLALADARRLRADLVLANDPDGDRLAVAVPDPAADGGWRRLTGDQVGALLGAFLLDATAADAHPEQRLVASTVVSSTLLSKIAATAGVRYAETLTGFKWIARAADHEPGARFSYGYEEALGYAVGEVVRDKDGISAAVALLGLAASARAAGESLLDRWDALEAAHGVHLDGQLTLATRAPGQIMAALRAALPGALGGHPVRSADDFASGGGLPPSDVLIFRLTGARVVLRPSGTEPKLKVYLEVVEPTGPGGLAAARQSAAARMAVLREASASCTGT
ncbi:MAG TPA: phospho-sugar mutase [Streptosporangiaceae bacterium]|nr:phospho-sugar mutase [Streptosporangiaceae bacterium]